MKVKARGNVVTICTDISKEDYDRFKDQGALVVYDEEGNAVYSVGYTQRSGGGGINGFSITGNSVVNGKITLTIIIDEEKSIEEFVERNATSLIALKDNEPVITQQLATQMNMYRSILSEVEVE